MTQWYQTEVNVRTPGRGALDISQKVSQAVTQSEVSTGLAHVFLKHTSASMMLCENADPTVLVDMETIFSRIAPDGDSEYQHDYEGDDDMAAHIRSVLTSNDITLPISAGGLNLGTWQGLFLFEHRYQPHSRKLIITVSGV